MDKLKKNKEFILRYINAISGVIKTRELIDKYVVDQGLIEHILFFEAAFPKYEMFIDEITAESNRVVLRGRAKGKHEGSLNGIPATHKTFEIPFSIGYEIENEKITNHWMIVDQMMLMEQLGVIGHLV
jgi:predicted ester cyclase